MRARRKRLQGVEQEKQQIAHALDKAQADLSDASDREQLRAGAPDVLIEGITPQNERIALRIPGASLVETAGATVGRSPVESAFVINHEQVSRRHFRLLLVSGQVMIEDLGFHERDRCKRRAPQSWRPAGTGQRQPRWDRPPGVYGAYRPLNESSLITLGDNSGASAA